MVFDNTFFTVYHMRKVTVPANWKNLVVDHSDLATQENFTPAKERYRNQSSVIPLSREAWQEDFLEPGPQDLPPWSNPQAVPSSIIEDPAAVNLIETSSHTSNPSTR